MSESKSEQEPTPSTSQIPVAQNKPLIPLVGLPKVVLTRLDINNLPVPVKVSPTKKPVKRLDKKMNKPITPNKIPHKATLNSKHDPRTRNRPKQNYKAMAEFGISFEKSPESNVHTKKVNSVKKEHKMTPKLDDRSVKSMLNKTMLQKRSKIAIPPAKKIKLTPTKPSLIKQKDKTPHVQPKTKNSSFKIENDSDADSLFDELIDEIVKRPQRKVVSERTTNITLKPNVGNKPPTIVKGGIVKKSSLPPDLKAVASPTSLNSSKHTAISLNVKGKSSMDENAVKAPATAESPKASLPPVKASPFPISLNSPKPASKDIGKKGRKIAETSVSSIIDDAPIDTSELKKSSSLGGNAQKQKLSVSTPKLRGRPKIGPKQVTKPAPSFSSTVTGDESDEYTEIETLENMDSDAELETAKEDNSTGNADIQEIKQNMSKIPNKSNTGRLPDGKIDTDEDPHLDLLRILTDDNETAVETESSESHKTEKDASRQDKEGTKEDLTASVVADNSTNQVSTNSKNTTARDSENTLDQQTDPPLSVKKEAISHPAKEVTEVFKEPMIEETPPVRTVYDLINEVSQQYPSWNLHIIPETNAFCIAQVTKGRLGLPTLKKCIELDAETYCAKVYIHQYHIKRFDGVYDSEEAILALIEEIHSIKA